MSYILAFAIEDRFQFAALRKDTSTSPLDVGTIEASEGFTDIELVGTMPMQLTENFQTTLGSQKSQYRPENVSAIAISCIGVIQKNRYLIQVPRSDWPKDHPPFDFADAIARALDWDTEVVAGKLKVYNDATASAAAAFYCLKHSQRQRIGSDEMAYLKVHNGVNVGVVTGSMDGVLRYHRPRHAELGHFLPLLDEVDADSEFRGTCTYHAWCLEGLLSRSALIERAELKLKGWPTYTNIDTLLKDPKVQSVAGFYLSQVLHHLVLSQESPAMIVVGGKLATKPIIQKAQSFLRENIDGYPKYERQEESDFIVRYQDLVPKIRIRTKKDFRYVELSGALILANDAQELEGPPRTSKVKIGAVSIGRSHASWMTATMSPGPSLLPSIQESAVSNHDYSEQETKDLRLVLKTVAEKLKYEKCTHVGISCWGPFRSLNIGNRSGDYSKIAPRQSDLNSGDIKIDDEFLDAIGRSSDAPDVYVITDANAVALGSLFKKAQALSFPFVDAHRDKEPIAPRYQNTVLASLLLGKGIGGGVIIGSKPLQRRYHPEIGHMVAARQRGDRRKWRGCKGHSDCYTSVLGHSNHKVQDGILKFPTNDDVRRYAQYAAQLCANIIYAVAPECLVISGSTIRTYPDLIKLIRKELRKLFRKRKTEKGSHIYQEEANMKDFIALADEDAAVWGALVFAADHATRATVSQRNKKTNGS